MILVGVWTRVGFSKFKNCRTGSGHRFQNFWNKIRVWKGDSGHLSPQVRGVQEPECRSGHRPEYQRFSKIGLVPELIF